MARTVKGLAAARLNPRATRCDQRIGLGYGEHRIGADHRCDIIIGQPLALVDVEDDKAFQERNLPCLAILAARLFLLALRREPVGIAADCALLAAPDIPHPRLGLPVGPPTLRRNTLGADPTPHAYHH